MHQQTRRTDPPRTKPPHASRGPPADAPNQRTPGSQRRTSTPRRTGSRRSLHRTSPPCASSCTKPTCQCTRRTNPLRRSRCAKPARSGFPMPHERAVPQQMRRAVRAGFPAARGCGAPSRSISAFGAVPRGRTVASSTRSAARTPPSGCTFSTAMSVAPAAFTRPWRPRAHATPTDRPRTGPAPPRPPPAPRRWRSWRRCGCGWTCRSRPTSRSAAPRSPRAIAGVTDSGAVGGDVIGRLRVRLACRRGGVPPSPPPSTPPAPADLPSRDAAPRTETPTGPPERTTGSSATACGRRPTDRRTRPDR